MRVRGDGLCGSWFWSFIGLCELCVRVWGLGFLDGDF